MTCSIRKGVLFRRYRVYAGLDQPVGKEAVLFEDLLRHFPARIGQMQEIVAVHCQEAPFTQGRHRHGTRWALKPPRTEQHPRNAPFLVSFGEPV